MNFAFENKKNKKMEVVCSKAEMRLIETQQRRKWPMKKTFHFSSRLGTIRELDCVRSSKKKTTTNDKLL